VADFRRDLRLADHVAVWKFIDYRNQPPPRRMKLASGWK
jgi:hypothetical protein